MLRSMLFLRLFTIIQALNICIDSGALFDSAVRSNNDIRNCPLFTCRDAESRKAVSVTYEKWYLHIYYVI